MPAVLHVVCGKPGAGKTSLARELARTTPAVCIVEDEWLLKLAAPIRNLADYLEATRKIRSVIAPLAVELLRLGTSVVFDFGGNTPRERAWVRSIFEAAGAQHTLHHLDVPDDVCRARVAARNETQPAGLFFGHVTEAQYDEVVPHISAPGDDEGFVVLRH